MARLTRRGFILSGAALGGGLVVGFLLWPAPDPRVRVRPGESLMNAWLKIGTDGEIIAVVPQVEMGQGVYTSLPMILADELDADFARVRVEAAPVDPLYANRVNISAPLAESELLPDSLKDLGIWLAEAGAGFLGLQITGGSSSMRNSWDVLRTAGAAARHMLIRAAAGIWQVPPGDCVARSGFVHHTASGRSLGFGDLAGRAARLKAPVEVSLKSPSEFTLIGTTPVRLDQAGKITGAAGFSIDVALPGMVYGAIKSVPHLGGRLIDYDAQAVLGLPGVLAVVNLGQSVGVVATSYWRARTAADKIILKFAPPDRLAGFSTSDLIDEHKRALAGDEFDNHVDRGNARKALKGPPAGRIIRADYSVPYLAHATMEPMVATAEVKEGRCRLWIGHQAASLAVQTAARILGLNERAVEIRTPYLGGGFGRRLEVDMVAQVVRLAAVVERPVKLIWSREEDIRHDFYRPMILAEFSALPENGVPKALGCRLASQSIMAGYAERALDLPALGPDTTTVEGLAGSPYDFAHYRVDHAVVDTPVPVGFWRSVGHSASGFFMESFLDELALDAGLDPFAYHFALLQKDARSLAVLEQARKMSGFGEACAPGAGQGLAFHMSFGARVAQVADIRLDGRGVHIERIHCVIDCGRPVHPDIIRAQMEGGIIFGLTAAFRGEISFKDGAVLESNFHDYEMLRLPEAPPVEVHIMDNGFEPTGVGEPGVPPVAPAIANAIVAAGGPRLRDLPFAAAGFRLAP